MKGSRLRACAVALAIALPPAGVTAAPDLAEVERDIVRRTNEFRGGERLAAVREDAKLARAARRFADFMARTDRYGHGADGREPAERVKAEGYDYCLVSENLSYQYSSHGFTTRELASRYVEGWKKSPGHRKNMADDAATETGVAVARSGDSGRYYAVQLFGRPVSQSIRFRIRNDAGERVEYRIGEDEFALAPRETALHRQCRREEVRVAAGRAPALVPGDGDRLAFVREGGRVVVRPAGEAARSSRGASPR